MMIMMILTLQTRRTSDSRHALRIYNAAVDDLETSAEDIAFLRSIFETERQADFDRANPVAFAAFTGAAYIDFSDQDWPTYFNVFRNAQITPRILIMCESYPFLLCLCFCSTYVLNLHIYSLYSDLILVLTRFLFYPYCYSRCGRLSIYSLSKGRLLYSFLFVHIS